MCFHRGWSTTKPTIIQDTHLQTNKERLCFVDEQILSQVRSWYLRTPVAAAGQKFWENNLACVSLNFLVGNIGLVSENSKYNFILTAKPVELIRARLPIMLRLAFFTTIIPQTAKHNTVVSLQKCHFFKIQSLYPLINTDETVVIRIKNSMNMIVKVRSCCQETVRGYFCIATKCSILTKSATHNVFFGSNKKLWR